MPSASRSARKKRSSTQIEEPCWSVFGRGLCIVVVVAVLFVSSRLPGGVGEGSNRLILTKPMRTVAFIGGRPNGAVHQLHVPGLVPRTPLADGPPTPGRSWASDRASRMKRRGTRRSLRPERCSGASFGVPPREEKRNALHHH